MSGQTLRVSTPRNYQYEITASLDGRRQTVELADPGKKRMSGSATLVLTMKNVLTDRPAPVRFSELDYYPTMRLLFAVSPTDAQMFGRLAKVVNGAPYLEVDFSNRTSLSSSDQRDSLAPGSSHTLSHEVSFSFGGSEQYVDRMAAIVSGKFDFAILWLAAKTLDGQTCEEEGRIGQLAWVFNVASAKWETPQSLGWQGRTDSGIADQSWTACTPPEWRP